MGEGIYNGRIYHGTPDRLLCNRILFILDKIASSIVTLWQHHSTSNAILLT